MSKPVLVAKSSIIPTAFMMAMLVALASSLAWTDPIVKTGTPKNRATPAGLPSPKALPSNVPEPPRYQLTTIPFHEGEKMVFAASWTGIPVATARIELHRTQGDPSVLAAEAWVQTNKFADLLFKMRDYMREAVDAQSLASQKMYVRQSENKRHNDFNASFDREAHLVTLVKSNHRGKETKRFVSSNPWGPLSGAMMALSLPMVPGQSYTVDLFTGSTRYVFDFKVEAREKITTQLGTFDAYRLIPRVDYESDGKLSASATGTVVWVSADNRRLPLRCESDAFIGKVRADLVQIGG